MKVLYVDALTAPNAVANVLGMTRAYSRVAEVETFDYRRMARRYNPTRMNDMLIQAATKFCPDFIHLGKCESVKDWAIARIKQNLPRVKVIHFYGDLRMGVVPWVVDIGRACDRTVMQIDGGSLVKAYENAGCKNIGYWPAGTDPEIYGPRKVKDRDLAVVFMGTLGSPRTFEWYDGRRKLVETLANAGNSVHVFGGGWDKVKHPRVHCYRYVGSDGFSQACSRSQIALGYSAKDVPGYTSWPRVLNSMVCGTFYLTRYFVGLEKTFQRGVHLDWFKSIPEAVEKVHYYLNHEDERDRIARAGRAEVLRNHTWDKRIKLMLSYAGFKARRRKTKLKPVSMSKQRKMDKPEPIELEVTGPKSTPRPTNLKTPGFRKRPPGSKPPRITVITRLAEGEPVVPLAHSLLSRRIKG